MGGWIQQSKLSTVGGELKLQDQLPNEMLGGGCFLQEDNYSRC